MEAWGSVIDYVGVSSIEGCLKCFECVCAPWPLFVEYVNKTWVIPHKEKFMKTWTDKVMHLGNITSNR